MEVHGEKPPVEPVKVVVSEEYQTVVDFFRATLSAPTTELTQTDQEAKTVARGGLL